MKSISIRHNTNRHKQQPKQHQQQESLESSHNLIQLLETTSPSERDYHTVIEISEHLTRLPFFLPIPKVDVENLAQHLQFRSFREHQTVLREGDKGKAFYIILKGRACVYKLDRPSQKTVEEETAAAAAAAAAASPPPPPPPPSSASASPSSSTAAHDHSSPFQMDSAWLQANNQRAAKEDELLLQKQYGGFVTALTSDDTFGEIAVSSTIGGKSQLRTASVVATSSVGCDVLVIHNEDFTEYVAPHGKGASFYAWKRCRDILRVPTEARSSVEIDLLCNFVQKISFFAQLSAPLRRKVCRCAQLQTMQASETIFEKNVKGTEFFIILNGEVLVVKNKERENKEEEQQHTHQHNTQNDKEDDEEEQIVARLCKGDAFGVSKCLNVHCFIGLLFFVFKLLWLCPGVVYIF